MSEICLFPGCNRHPQKNGSKLTFIEYAGRDKYNKRLGLFQCECGNKKVIKLTDVKNNLILSCGCLRGSIFRKHGFSRKRLHNIWQGLKDRCLNSKNKRFKDYGGRGIKVCNEWLEYMNFHNWAITNGYADNLTIDRREVNGDYSPGNCRWITQKQNSNNRRDSKYVTFKGETKTLSEWAEVLNINSRTLRARLCIYKWPVERVLTEKTHIK